MGNFQICVSVPSRHLGFGILGEFANFKMCDLIMGIRSHTFPCFFRIFAIVKVKFGQLLVWFMENIYNLFFFYFYCEDWKLVLGLFIILINVNSNAIC